MPHPRSSRNRTRTTITTTIFDPHDPNWRTQLRAAIRSCHQLQRSVCLTDMERAGVERSVRVGMPLLIPPYYLSLMDQGDPSCPIRRQCVPHDAESRCVPGDLGDPLGEQAYEVAPYLVRRYPDRVLLLATSTCAVHCRFCTRSRWVGKREGYVSLRALEPAFQWLERHPEIREVLVSGGDPLVASTERIDALLCRIRSIDSVEVIRIGTRVPVVLPMRVDDELVSMLRSHHPLWLMTHFNHPRELSEWSCGALRRLVDAGIPVMNQTVLLRGINDNADTLTSLFRGLVRERVRPYYLLHADAVVGTGHLRTSLAKSIELYGQLQGRLSGIAVPRLMVDTPGGHGKVPVGPNTVVHMGDGRTVLRTFRRDHVTVIDPDPEFATEHSEGTEDFLGDDRDA